MFLERLMTYAMFLLRSPEAVLYKMEPFWHCNCNVDQGDISLDHGGNWIRLVSVYALQALQRQRVAK